MNDADRQKLWTCTRDEWQAALDSALPTLVGTVERIDRIMTAMNGMQRRTVRLWEIRWTILGVDVDVEMTDADVSYRRLKDATAALESGEDRDIVVDSLGYLNSIFYGSRPDTLDEATVAIWANRPQPTDTES